MRSLRHGDGRLDLWQEVVPVSLRPSCTGPCSERLLDQMVEKR